MGARVAGDGKSTVLAAGGVGKLSRRTLLRCVPKLRWMPEHWKQMNSPRLIDAHAFCATAIPSAREHNRVSLVGRMRNAVTEQSDTRNTAAACEDDDKT